MNEFHTRMQSYISDKKFHSLASHEAVDEFVTLLEESGYKFIACDFDATMIELHSGGYVNPDVDKDVLESVTPDFKSLAKRLKTSPISLAIVTFSDAVHVKGHPKYISGEEMVHAALKHSDCDADIAQVYAFYPRFWDSPKMYSKLGLDKPMPLRKEYHLKRICADFDVKLEEIILIDDDIENCKGAKALGATALYVTGEGFKLKEVELL
ncbi:hypothetical protein BEWA_005130 [Theileria equi strain WA]|uniref:Uncharacterized protein n=1 Tax=Theileria equi strain WA TaxID=1537102 RepID=L0AZV7_THEEQ|nr:hypothetical protein BEWA_005130 [Theileria equi strain WA]AFZ81105.1 hypothetical protein BEWA_005130 [Theileria equi strain WA]|eukprot:XP_004830771.1 hypothetical protein BEWA_005130 [Theileria equi strain WA]